MNYPSADFGQKSANRKVRKLLGRAYLRENRISEALEVYLGILKDHPDEEEVLVVMGNLYRLSGSQVTAERLYSRVFADNPEILQFVKQVQAPREQNNPDWEPSDPLSEEAITCLAERLQGKTDPEKVEEIRASADLLDQIVIEKKPAESNGNGRHTEVRQKAGHQSAPGQPPLPAGQQAPLAEDVQQLLPALIAQNIRQARAEGYNELAESLQSLQISLARQVEDRWADDLLRDEPPPGKPLEP